VPGIDPHRLQAAVDLLCQSIALRQEDRFPEALDRLDRALALCPEFIPGRTARTELLAVLDADPDNVASLNRKGCALVELGRLDEALPLYRRIVELDPRNADAGHDLGNVLQRQLRFGEALDAYRQSISIDAEHAEAHIELAHCLLAQGDWAQAWPRYEWRWKTAQLAPHRFDSGRPAWTPACRLDGLTVLVWAEQGYGDTIQFARFLPQLAQVAKKLIVRAPAILHELIATVAPQATLIGEDADEIPQHDINVPLMSLPFALGIEPTPSAPYLRADPARIERWNALLGPRQRPRIGIAWRGRQGPLANPTRDLDPGFLEPLAELDIDFVSLQNRAEDHSDAALQDWPRLHNVSAELVDFSETAALLEGLDLVISVDTAVIHLAAALGRPCWLLLRHSGEWRWQLEPNPWYPTLRIFRQPTAGDWNAVVERVAMELWQQFPSA
jgi:hypothetical protein